MQVTTGAGQTYEREAIATWLRTKQTDPLTGARLPSKKLIENVVARRAGAASTQATPSSATQVLNSVRVRVVCMWATITKIKLAYECE